MQNTGNHRPQNLQPPQERGGASNADATGEMVRRGVGRLLLGPTVLGANMGGGLVNMAFGEDEESITNSTLASIRQRAFDVADANAGNGKKRATRKERANELKNQLRVAEKTGMIRWVSREGKGRFVATHAGGGGIRQDNADLATSTPVGFWGGPTEGKPGQYDNLGAGEAAFERMMRATGGQPLENFSDDQIRKIAAAQVVGDMASFGAGAKIVGKMAAPLASMIPGRLGNALGAGGGGVFPQARGGFKGAMDTIWNHKAYPTAAGAGAIGLATGERNGQTADEFNSSLQGRAALGAAIPLAGGLGLNYFLKRLSNARGGGFGGKVEDAIGEGGREIIAREGQEGIRLADAVGHTGNPGVFAGRVIKNGSMQDNLAAKNRSSLSQEMLSDLGKAAKKEGGFASDVNRAKEATRGAAENVRDNIKPVAPPNYELKDASGKLKEAVVDSSNAARSAFSQRWSDRLSGLEDRWGDTAVDGIKDILNREVKAGGAETATKLGSLAKEAMKAGDGVGEYWLSPNNRVRLLPKETKRIAAILDGVDDGELTLREATQAVRALKAARIRTARTDVAARNDIDTGIRAIQGRIDDALMKQEGGEAAVQAFGRLNKSWRGYANRRDIVLETTRGGKNRQLSVGDIADKLFGARTESVKVDRYNALRGLIKSGKTKTTRADLEKLDDVVADVFLQRLTAQGEKVPADRLLAKARRFLDNTSETSHRLPDGLLSKIDDRLAASVLGKRFSGDGFSSFLRELKGRNGVEVDSFVKEVSRTKGGNEWLRSAGAREMFYGKNGQFSMKNFVDCVGNSNCRKLIETDKEGVEMMKRLDDVALAWKAVKSFPKQAAKVDLGGMSPQEVVGRLMNGISNQTGQSVASMSARMYAMAARRTGGLWPTVMAGTNFVERASNKRKLKGLENMLSGLARATAQSGTKPLRGREGDKLFHAARIWVSKQLEDEDTREE